MLVTLAALLLFGVATTAAPSSVVTEVEHYEPTVSMLVEAEPAAPAAALVPLAPPATRQRAVVPLDAERLAARPARARAGARPEPRRRLPARRALHDPGDH